MEGRRHGERACRGEGVMPPSVSVLPLSRSSWVGHWESGGGGGARRRRGGAECCLRGRRRRRWRMSGGEKATLCGSLSLSLSLSFSQQLCVGLQSRAAPSPDTGTQSA